VFIADAEATAEQSTVRVIAGIHLEYRTKDRPPFEPLGR
jgi:hypothetical protein